MLWLCFVDLRYSMPLLAITWCSAQDPTVSFSPGAMGRGLRDPALWSLHRASAAQMGYEEPETTELWFNKFSSKGDYEPNHIILCYINELYTDQVKAVWREGEVEERKKGRKRPRECLAWALAEGTKSQGVHGPVDPSTSVKVFENAMTLPFSSHLFFPFCSCGWVITSVWTLATMLSFRQDQVEGSVTHRKGQTLDCQEPALGP